MRPTLLLGYGNTDRQDDGVAWHVLNSINTRLGRKPAASPDDEFEAAGLSPELQFVLQLTPEITELVSKFERICFIDAHTGAVSEDIHQETVAPEYQSSPFTHHMTPAMCLALAQMLYGCQPEAILVSIRAYEFAFDRKLSPQTAGLVEATVEQIWSWLNHSSPPG